MQTPHHDEDDRAQQTRRRKGWAFVLGLTIAACSAAGTSDNVAGGPSGNNGAGGGAAGKSGGEAGTTSSPSGGMTQAQGGEAGAAQAGAAGATSGAGGMGKGGAAAAGKGGSGGIETAFGGGSQGGETGTGGMGGDPDAGTPDAFEACDTVSAAATQYPLTMYVLQDRSQSLDGDKWVVATAGLQEFINDKASAGLSVGLTFFPRDDVAPTTPPCSIDPYIDPQVPFGKLPGNAMALVDAVKAASPAGFGTPVWVALSGAVEKGFAFAQSNPNERYVILLVTDGKPESPPDTCGGQDVLDPAVTAAQAEVAFKQHNIRTFVVGLPGVDQSFANLVAQKGGSDKAIFVQPGAAAESFREALAKVRGDSLGCEFALPADSKKYNKDQVNVRYTPSSGMAQDLSRSPGCADKQGWDYDNDAMPTKVVLCGGVCDTVKKDGLAKVDVLLGCPTRISLNTP